MELPPFRFVKSAVQSMLTAIVRAGISAEGPKGRKPDVKHGVKQGP